MVPVALLVAVPAVSLYGPRAAVAFDLGLRSMYGRKPTERGAS